MDAITRDKVRAAFWITVRIFNAVVFGVAAIGLYDIVGLSAPVLLGIALYSAAAFGAGVHEWCRKWVRP